MTTPLSSQFSDHIDQEVAARNIKVIADFPGLGSRLITPLSWWSTAQPQRDSMARIFSAKDHALSRLYHMQWAMQVGYEYAGYKEDINAINQSIALTFSQVFGDLTPMPKGEGKGNDASESRARQIDAYKNALRGLRNLCLVYGQRYRKDASKQGEMEQLLSTYASQYRAFCVLNGKSGEQLETAVRDEIHRTRGIIDSRELEGEDRQIMLAAIQGMHTKEEMASGGAKKVPITFQDLTILVHPQFDADILRTPNIMIAGEPVGAHGQTKSDKLQELFKRLQEAVGPLPADALADIAQILVSQTFSACVTAKAFEKYAVMEGPKQWALKMKEHSCSLVEDGQDLVFIRQGSFDKFDPTQGEPDPQFIVETLFEIRIPKSKFFENRLRKENLSDIQMTYSMTELPLK